MVVSLFANLNYRADEGRPWALLVAILGINYIAIREE